MNKKQLYFASSNSMTGFQSYFDLIYNPNKFKRIYIIKGGPGTGKSTTLKAVGEQFEKSCKCEYFLCSSDPKSLDGIIIDDKIAVIDGTSPHTADAKFPVAVEIIIDNARGMNQKISKEKNKIIELSGEKKKLYDSAYTYLRAAGEIKKEYSKLIAEKTDIGKLDAAIERFIKQSLKNGESYSETIRLTQALTSNGKVDTKSFESISQKTAIVINGRGYEEIVYRRFIEAIKKHGIKCSISFDPLIPWSPNALCFNELSACVVNYNEEIHGEIDYDKYKVFNCERFIDKAFINSIRAKLRFASKCHNALLDEAYLMFNESAKKHKELEDIYVNYNDFRCVDENINKIINEISTII